MSDLDEQFVRIVGRLDSVETMEAAKYVLGQLSDSDLAEVIVEIVGGDNDLANELIEYLSE